MTEAAEDRLMRYLDGEVSAEEARDVERWLEESAEARALAADLAAVGDAVRALADEQGAAADGVADAVLLQIERAAAPVPLERARERAATRKASRFVPAVALALAAAAAVAVYVRSRPAAPSVAVADPTPTPLEARPPTSTPAEGMAAAEEGPGAAIESVDFGAQNGTIFMVAHGPETTPVVWLVDDGEATEG